MTTFQKYVFQSIMDLFGKDLAENFLFALTFADASKPIIMDSLKDKQHGFG